MIKAVLGQSENIDTRTAVDSVIVQCQQKLLGRRPQAGIVFAGVNFDHRLMLDKILDTFPGLDLVGCSTAGEFSSSFGYSDDSISLMLFYSDDIEIGIGVGRSLSENPSTAVQSAVDQASHNLSKQATIGKNNFREIIRRNAQENAHTIMDAVYDGLDQHTRGLKSDDDITLVVAKVHTT